MFCKYCGKELDDGSAFCKYCGKAQSTASFCTCAAGCGTPAQNSTADAVQRTMQNVVQKAAQSAAAGADAARNAAQSGVQRRSGCGSGNCSKRRTQRHAESPAGPFQKRCFEALESDLQRCSPWPGGQAWWSALCWLCWRRSHCWSPSLRSIQPVCRRAHSGPGVCLVLLFRRASVLACRRWKKGLLLHCLPASDAEWLASIRDEFSFEGARLSETQPENAVVYLMNRARGAAGGENGVLHITVKHSKRFNSAESGGHWELQESFMPMI